MHKGLTAALVVGIASGAPLFSCSSGDREIIRPNLVLVSIDTLRADALSTYGGPVDTPSVARLARDGVVFERAFAPSAETAPSHASLLTGLDVPRHGVTQNGIPIPEDVAWLPSLFREHGYQTAAFVSSWVLAERFGWPRGFDVYDDSFGESTSSLGKRGEGNALDRLATPTTDRARGWLLTAREPFFLFVHYFDPHGPYVPPVDWAGRARETRFDVRDRAIPGVAPERLLDLVSRYHGEVMYTDDSLGHLLAAVRDRESTRPTLLVVTSDHGEGLGEHGWLEHSVQLYDETIHVPLLFQGLSGLPRGRRFSNPVGLVDVAPTLLELAGLPQLERADGRSLAPDLRRGSEPEPRPLYAHRRRFRTAKHGVRAEPQAAVRTVEWKYLRTVDGEEELYDLRDDPDERRNLVGTQPAELEHLRSLLDAHLARGAREPAAEIPEDVRSRLEALGYVD